MSGYIEGTDRSQATLFPDRLEDWIDEDSPVRVIDLFVEEIDLGEIGFLRAAPPQIIGTFDYAYLVSAAIWGFVFFAERPDGLNVLGMALITVAGLLVAERETEPVTIRETS